jgi:hypothetical protein
MTICRRIIAVILRQIMTAPTSIGGSGDGVTKIGAGLSEDEGEPAPIVIETVLSLKLAAESVLEATLRRSRGDPLHAYSD